MIPPSPLLFFNWPRGDGGFSPSPGDPCHRGRRPGCAGIPSPLGRSPAQEGGIPFYTQTDAVRLFIPSDSSGEFSSPGELAAQWEIGWELGSSGFLLDSYTALREPYQSTAELLLCLPSKNP